MLVDYAVCDKLTQNKLKRNIMAVFEEKAYGIHYCQHGDVYVTHQQNPKGYDYLWVDELDKLIKKQ